MNTSFRSTLIAATSAAMLALAPAAFAAGLATENAAGNSTGVPHPAMSGQQHTNGTQTAANSSSSEMNATGKTGTTSGPAAHSNAVPNTAVTKEQKSGAMETAQTGTNGSSEMKTTGKASLGAGAPGTAAKPGTEAGGAAGHKASQQ